MARLFHFLPIHFMGKTATSPAHTPGPWRIADGDNDELLIIAGSTAMAEVLPYGGKRSLAYREQKANGCLIAAAPELLELAKMSLADAEEVLAHPDKAAAFNWACIRDDLRMIIAKAEGRSFREP